MSIQIYVYDAADYDEPQLVEELDDLDDAVARCHDLVENDGHARAEAWDDDGDCRYVWADNEKPRSLDMEFKFLENGKIVLKQSREFHGQ